MARKAREILKARGYSDEELNGLTMLTDARFVKAIEDEDVERERLQSEVLKKDTMLDQTTDWYNKTAQPALQKATRDAIDARAEAEAAKARLKAAQDYGLARVLEQEEGTPAKPAAAAAAPGGQPDDRYVSAEVFQQTTDRFGEAIATATDLAEDHRDLFGARLPGGVGTLRKEYQDAVRNHRFGGDLRAFWEQKYNVSTKRTEIATKAVEERETRIRADERAKVLSENLNPATRSPISSRSPFVAKAATREGGTGGGNQPWEKGSPEQRQSGRVLKIAQKINQSA